MIYYILFFLLNAVEMIMETSASRVLAPSLGTTNAVWIAIIGIILLANSLGNYVGGKLTEKFNSKILLVATFTLTSALIFVIPFSSENVPLAILRYTSSVEISAIISSVCLFFLPTFALSIATPVMMKELLTEEHHIGKQSGKIHAIMAIGSLFGTFIGGFILIPTFGCKTILYILSIVMALTCFLFVKPKNKKPFIVGIAWLMVICMTIVGTAILNNPDAVLDPESNASVSIDGEYSRIIIENVDWNGERARLYRSSAAFSSGTYLDEDKKYENIYTYMDILDSIIYQNNVQEVMMIGGAAYMYPRYFISHYPEGTIDVVEIEPKAVEIAMKYFFLDDLIHDYNLTENPRLGLYTNDGRMYLKSTDKKYDCVVNDAFSGGEPVATLATVEALEDIKAHLNDSGLYAMNIMGSISGDNSLWLRSEYKTAKEVFPYVYIVPTEPDYATDEYTNLFIICASYPLSLGEDAIVLTEQELASPAIVLTDDYCPVEQISARRY